MQRHEWAQLALDCALHGLPEPSVPWRNNIPANPFHYGKDGRGYLGTGRSANIDTMTVAAWVGFVASGIAPKKERAQAIAMAADVLAANQAIFMLNEFGSTTYSGWTLIAWGVIAWALELLGESKLAAGFRSLLTQWFVLARASMARCPVEGLHVKVRYTIRGGKTAEMDESRFAGKDTVVICGERSWGNGHGVAFAHHAIARVAFGMESPKPVRQLPDPGRTDGWQERGIAKLASLFRACAEAAVRLYPTSDWQGMVGLLKYPTANPCELRLYADGSRIFIEGANEPEEVDEDDSNSTMRLALLAIYRTPPRILSLPAWPAPNSGDTRIRSTPTFSDIDRDIHGNGWVLFHSSVGDIHVNERWLSKAPDPSAALIARFTCFGFGGVWAWAGPGGASGSGDFPPAAPEIPDSPSPPRPPRRRRSWWRRLLGLD